MDTLDEILLILGEMRGKLVQIRKLSERVAALEQMQAWLKGAWTLLAVALASAFKAIYGK